MVRTTTFAAGSRKTWDTESEEILAFYRIVAQGWSKEDAINELRNGGYNFHEMWHNIVRRIEKADIDAMKKQLAGEK